MKKTIVAVVLLLLCALCWMSGCEKAPTWQDLYDAGIEYMEGKEYDQAIVSFQQAIELDGSKPEAYGVLADVYLAMEEMERHWRCCSGGWKQPMMKR